MKKLAKANFQKLVDAVQNINPEAAELLKTDETIQNQLGHFINYAKMPVSLVLRNAFIWKDTSKGHRFWKGIYTRLVQLEGREIFKQERESKAKAEKDFEGAAEKWMRKNRGFKLLAKHRILDGALVLYNDWRVMRCFGLDINFINDTFKRIVKIAQET